MLKKIITLCLFTFVISSTAYGNETSEPKLIAAFFYADWCGSCKVLDPKIENVKKASQLDSKSILFVTFDLTSDNTKHQASLMTEALGLSSIYKKYGGKTGFMLLIDANTKQVKSTFTKRMSEKTIETIFNQSLNNLG